MNEAYLKNVIEAALLASGRPLAVEQIAQLFDEHVRPSAAEVRTQLGALSAEYAPRGIEMKETASGFRVQVRGALASEISRLWPERPPRFSRALLETLALIAYRQPITRAEIESVRGVAVNPNITKTLLERQWFRGGGHRALPGRPELLGTTREFLEYFGLKSLDELPPLSELHSLGEFDPQLDLAVAAEADGASASGEPAAAAAGDQFDEEAGDAEASEAEEFGAAPRTIPGLVASPPDDSR